MAGFYDNIGKLCAIPKVHKKKPKLRPIIRLCGTVI